MSEKQFGYYCPKCKKVVLGIPSIETGGKPSTNVFVCEECKTVVAPVVEDTI